MTNRKELVMVDEYLTPFQTKVWAVSCLAGEDMLRPLLEPEANAKPDFWSFDQGTKRLPDVIDPLPEPAPRPRLNCYLVG